MPSKNLPKIPFGECVPFTGTPPYLYPVLYPARHKVVLGPIVGVEPYGEARRTATARAIQLCGLPVSLQA
ncbi:hypothetical protein GCM10022213_22870 [Parerythrobacter jejuensis]